MGLLEILLIVVILLWLMGTFVAPVGSVVHLLIIVFIVLLIIKVAQGWRIS